MAFDDIITRSDAGLANLPDGLRDQLVTAITAESVVLTLGRKVPTTTKDSRIPVLTEAPSAYWLDGDDGLKQTSKAVFTPQSLIAEELAVIVVIPDAVASDNEFGIWEAVRPLLVRAAARRIDSSIIFGIDKPSSWPDALVTHATDAGAIVTGSDPSGSSYDPVGDLVAAAELVGAAGFPPSAAVTRHGWQFAAARLRSDSLVANPIGANSPLAMMVAGLPLFTRPPYWEPVTAELVVADWSQVIVGIRQDLRLEMFNSGIIQDEGGNIVSNLMQQDSKALRMTMRIGYRLVEPVTDAYDAGSPVAIVAPFEGS